VCRTESTWNPCPQGTCGFESHARASSNQGVLSEQVMLGLWGAGFANVPPSHQRPTVFDSGSEDE
jgi:hypothetical protein